VGPLDAYRIALRRIGPLLRAVGLFVVAWLLLTTSAFLLPVALWIGVRWCLLAPAVELEGLRGIAALRRSGALVRGRWIRVASLVGLSALLALASGPLLGVALIFTTSAPFVLLNIVAGVVYTLAFPFVGLVTAYVYFDARVHEALEPARERARELPPEIELGPA
jgi:hypothetical protein